MTVRTLKKRLSERRLSGLSLRRVSSGLDASVSHNGTALRPSFRESFSFKRSNDPNATSPSQHRRSTKAHRQFLPRIPRRPSMKSLSLNTTDVKSYFIDSVTQALAIKSAEETKENFQASIPQSLAQAHVGRDCVAPFQPDEVVLGKKLGSGEFSEVYEVQSFQFQFQQHVAEDTDMSTDELSGRLSMKKYEKYRETKKSRYALKHINEKYYMNGDSESYIQAASDLALEAEFLASLQHPNIIKLRGIAHSGAAGFADGPRGYFLVIDRLFDTLDLRMKKWRGRILQGKRVPIFSRRLSFSSDFSPSNQEISDPMLKGNEIKDEQFNTALQIAAAMAYLHKHSIIFRDLKPANIGFDVRGDVKIFDFGLARIMPNNGDPYIDQFDMSGAGSPRYMAPECLCCSPYNMKADVYTFAIILWEMLAGQIPFSFARTRYQLINDIVEANVRPVIDKSWHASIQGMLESSFDSCIGKRPKMTLWLKVIHEVLASLRGGDTCGLGDNFVSRRRSNESMSDTSQDP